MKINIAIKKLKHNIIKAILLIILSLSIIFFSLPIIKWYIDDNKITIINTELESMKIYDKHNEYDEFKIYIDDLKEMNDDAVGWIKINNTKIDYPIVQTDNNYYYLKRDFNKSNNNAGTIFMDYRNSANDLDKNTVIYGHARKNETMFGSLKNTLKKEWYENKSNHTFYTLIGNEKFIWEVFSVYKIKAEDYYIRTKFNEEEFTDFLITISNRSLYNFNIELNEKDYILTLSTCADTEGINRIVVHSKLIEKKDMLHL